VIAGQMLDAAEMEIASLIPPSVLSYTSQYAFARERAKKLITNGGHVRGITNISFCYVHAVRQLLDIGEDVRHVDNSQEVLIFVRDKTESVSSINAITNELLLNDQIVAFWSEDPVTLNICYPPSKRPGQRQSLQQSGY
jgi:hypothetical protein